MKLWVIVNRNGNPYFSHWKYAYTSKTRKAAIERLAEDCFGGTVERVWKSFQRDGYDCIRMEVKPWHNSDAKRERDGEAASDE